ncbi:MAG: PQQ-binding-like beta-propeller repeat protein [Deltaproteobacteria bacterium]|nr:PQQ-binding-like beta-propeller repeat protein [Deltaproteobacteria bacterium]
MALLGCGGRPGILPGWGDADGGPSAGPAGGDATTDGPWPRNECPMGGGLQPGSPWPMRGRCPSHAGRASVNGPQSARLRWTFQTAGPVTSSPVVAADGTLYFGSRDRAVYAIGP